MTVASVHKKRLKTLGRIILITSLTAVIVFFSILLIRAYDARGFDDLQIWHRVKLTHEFNRHLYSPNMTFETYQKIEARLFDELDRNVFAKVGDSDQDAYNRYSRSSLSCPDRFSQNWNRSFEMIPSHIKGGVLLIHGLTDSPYSMRSAAKVFCDNGFYVLVLRMPGHGTVPAALTTVSWRDWLAAARVGVGHVRRKIGHDLPFILGGYSNGAALSLLYTLTSLNNKAFDCPDRVVLFSPALAISKKAVLADWLELTSVIPYFEKSKWKSLGPEYDPFKYNSFPLNAAEQSYRLAKKIRKMLRQGHLDGNLSEMPPVLTFQSIVDSTVIGEATVNELYDRLSPGAHELVIFDFNQNAFMKNYIKSPLLRSILEAQKSKRLSYALTIITNSDQDSDLVVARTKDEDMDSFAQVQLQQSWPQGVYSLSHVAIPFPVDDPVYGIETSNTSSDHIQLGSLYLRGEKGGLRISEKVMLRLRCNPFWEYVSGRLNDLIDKSVVDSPSEAGR